MFKKKKLIFINFNEINFDLLEKYSQKYNLLNLKKILNLNFKKTISEKNYELLEPWIQWLSIYTGKSANEHNVFRLGDVKNLKNTDFIFEKIESKGFKVGCIAPMNATNQLKNPSYFISDPWTNTKNDNSFWNNKISKLISKLVNNNSSGRIGIIDFILFNLVVFRYTRFSKYPALISLILNSFKKKWYRALLLDFIFNEIHIKLLKKNNPNFSNIFFNAGAHIQHHYLFFSEFNKNNFLKNMNWYLNDKYDPIYDMLKIYDKIFSDYFKLLDTDLIIATGLSQDILKELLFYYRINDHKFFLKTIKIKFKEVLPRMSRDFLINFDNINETLIAEKIFKEAKVVGTDINPFKKVDNRGESLFITLTFSKQITKDLKIKINNIIINFYNFVNFVAIKNGSHNGSGYLYYQDNIQIDSQEKQINVKDIFKYIENYFE